MDTELIDEYIAEAREASRDYSAHHAAIRRFVNKNIISPLSGIKENPHKWKVLDAGLATWED